VETFGAPMLDPDVNRELFEEQIDIIFNAFNAPAFAHHGKHYTLPPRVPYRGYELTDLTLVPQPARRPVDCWQPIVSASPRGLDFMAKHGIKGMIGGGAASGGAASQTVIAWQEALKRHGRELPLGADLVIGLTFHIADSEDEAIREARPYFEEWMKMFAPLGFVRGLSEEQVRAIGDPRLARSVALPTLEEAVRTGAWIVGPPERLVERLQAMQEMYPGLEEVQVGQVVGTDERVILEQLDRFATEVMPAFKVPPGVKGGEAPFEIPLGAPRG